jgi:hypothetical protein
MDRGSDDRSNTGKAVDFLKKNCEELAEQDWVGGASRPQFGVLVKHDGIREACGLGRRPGAVERV